MTHNDRVTLVAPSKHYNELLITALHDNQGTCKPRRHGELACTNKYCYTKRFTMTFKGPATPADNKTAPELNDTCQKEVRMPSDTESSLLDGNSHTTAWPGGRPYATPFWNVLTQSSPYRNSQSYTFVFRCLLLWTVRGYRSGRRSWDGYKLRLRRSLRNF